MYNGKQSFVSLFIQLFIEYSEKGEEEIKKKAAEGYGRFHMLREHSFLMYVKVHFKMYNFSSY